MGQALMISYGAMLGKIKKAILGNDDGDTKKLLELLLDTWIDAVEDQLKENTVYQGKMCIRDRAFLYRNWGRHMMNRNVRKIRGK